MLELTILEGSRGTGKTTVARKIRDKVAETTLINPTGFHLDGQEGFDKITTYYDEWMYFLNHLHNEDMHFLFDRFYFSEAVYSQLYKSYNFLHFYDRLNGNLKLMANNGVKIDIVLLTNTNEESLKSRLIRDKVPFGKAEETVQETLKQQDKYIELFANLMMENHTPNLSVFFVDTDDKSVDMVYEEILQLKTTK